MRCKFCNHNRFEFVPQSRFTLRCKQCLFRIYSKDGMFCDMCHRMFSPYNFPLNGCCTEGAIHRFLVK